MNIKQHMQLSQQQRQSHIDLSTDCFGHVNLSGKNKGQLSKLYGHAKKYLLNYHNIEDFKGNSIHTCHLCPNNSMSPNGFVCVNPQHLYFGSVKENHNDLDVNGNITGGRLGGKRGGKKSGKLPSTQKNKNVTSKRQIERAKRGEHVAQQLVKCPHCGKEGRGPIMQRWHFNYCKHKA